jgi:hypothetical protein
MSRRIAFTLPDWHEKQLMLWADCKGISVSGLSNNIVQSRIEVNKDHIEEMIAERAKDLGITADELKARILHSYSPDA